MKNPMKYTYDDLRLEVVGAIDFRISDLIEYSNEKNDEVSDKLYVVQNNIEKRIYELKENLSKTIPNSELEKKVNEFKRKFDFGYKFFNNEIDETSANENMFINDEFSKIEKSNTFKLQTMDITVSDEVDDFFNEFNNEMQDLDDNISKKIEAKSEYFFDKIKNFKKVYDDELSILEKAFEKEINPTVDTIKQYDLSLTQRRNLKNNLMENNGIQQETIKIKNNINKEIKGM